MKKSLQRKLLQYIKKQMLLVDLQGQFLFMANRKVCLHSIARHLLADRILIRKDRPTMYKHILREHTLEVMSSMFKFTIVRNPWDRVVSAFFANIQTRWKRDAYREFKNMGDEGFAVFVKTKLAHGIGFDAHIDHQYTKAYIGSNKFVDFIGKFESLDKDWPVIADAIGCSHDLPHKNVSRRGDYRQYYDQAARKIIRDIYEPDIKLFGYKF